MSKSAAPTRSRGALIAAAILFAPAVGAGVVVGRSGADRPATNPQAIAGAALVDSAENERMDVAACEKRLAAQRETKAPNSNPAIAQSAVLENAGRAPTMIEELEGARKKCRRSEVVTDAEICVASARQLRALMALPKDGLRCGPKSRAADLIEENFERCAAFAAMPTDIGSENLTKEESQVMMEAIRVHQTLTEDELLRQLNEFVRTCPETPPSLPPSLKTNAEAGETQ